MLLNLEMRDVLQAVLAIDVSFRVDKKIVLSQMVETMKSKKSLFLFKSQLNCIIYFKNALKLFPCSIKVVRRNQTFNNGTIIFFCYRFSYKNYVTMNDSIYCKTNCPQSKSPQQNSNRSYKLCLLFLYATSERGNIFILNVNCAQNFHHVGFKSTLHNQQGEKSVVSGQILKMERV